MSSDPLAIPEPDSSVLPTFVRTFGLDLTGKPLDVLERVGQAFARLPYENLTKIIRQAETGSVTEARRSPSEVVANHLRLGVGGTCFSLTATLLYLVRALGFEAQPILADRPYGLNTHCALLVWLDGRPHLMDPGFLIARPTPLPVSGDLKLQTEFNELILAPQAGGDKVDLITVQQGRWTPRITFKSTPADRVEFLKVWDASFDWDMMKYPLLTRVTGNRQLYLHGNRLQVRDRNQVQRDEIDPQLLAEHIAQAFGVALEVVQKALAILKRKGEPYGASG
ncbi:MAG TPA: arylamine N-acetyltransferase [Gemmataceae bacterium]|jgi:arylamine N-acetyltransferase|nr:arylamine N-acetyltransferase [Gemmataceae bacterium]